ncbi:hypothetical protein GCM10007859_14380 [Brevundimonas denitrificans]|uniref:DUF2975 domain-containing protein n=1 Tax=Brevundimonas denitrificans TaxID=1443434 RepID=A0ABQ6BIA2_9CAUL|nr:DUF2975 domain-containing protein [Brevundimonas denitrificans]GLS01424.1 hypothetical protein GCM10007859_14380 [Brevundimonas denitrificans]
MSQTNSSRFRQRCAQFRWLAVFMVVSVGALLALMHIVAPGVMLARGDYTGTPTGWTAQIVWALPTVFYLFAVWSIGAAMGQLSKGRLIQPTLVHALRRVGLSLGLGGLFSVFGVTNLVRLIEGGRGGWAYFDVAGMTLGVIGGALFLLGGVMEQAGKIQAELDEMI